MGIARTEESLTQGLVDVEYYQSVAGQIHYDASVSAYENYSLAGILATAHASLSCALARRESRGSHWRNDASQTLDDYAYATLVSYNDGANSVWLDKEREYES